MTGSRPRACYPMHLARPSHTSNAETTKEYASPPPLSHIIICNIVWMVRNGIIKAHATCTEWRHCIRSRRTRNRRHIKYSWLDVGFVFFVFLFLYFSLVAQNNILLITSHFAWDRPFSFKAFDFVEIQFPSASNGFLALGNQHYPQTRSALSRSL